MGSKARRDSMSGFERVRSVEGLIVMTETGRGQDANAGFPEASCVRASITRPSTMFAPDESPIQVTRSPAEEASCISSRYRRRHQGKELEAGLLGARGGDTSEMTVLGSTVASCAHTHQCWPEGACCQLLPAM